LTLHREDRNHIAVLRIEHGKANAIDAELFQELAGHLADLAADPPAAVVLTGTGSIFSAGVDLFRVLGEDASYLERFLPVLATTLRDLFTLPLPVVAAVNGHAIAGGCILAAACDHRVLADGSAKMGVTELLVGVPFPVVPFEVMRHLLPEREVQSLVYSGRTVSVQEALKLGLVDELAPPEAVLDRALEVASRLARIPRAAFAISKELARRPAVERMERYANSFAARTLEIWSSDETRTVMRQFLDRTVGKK